MKIYNFQTKQTQAEQKSKKSSFAFVSKYTSKLPGFLKHLPWPKIATYAFRIGAAGLLFVAILFIYYSRQLPDPNRLLGRNVPESTKIYAKDESLIYEVHGEIKRTLVNLDQISPDLKNATLAAEDKNFYKHSGVSFTGLARSVIVDIIYREKRQGGSTITQQFVKNAILTRDKSFIRKIKEIIISIELEARFSKDEIFKLYLNEIPYGRNSYGIEAASQTYFNKHASELTLAESAYLAALPQAPSYYNPSGPNFDDLQARQKRILNTMEELKMITPEQKEAALNEEVKFETIKTAIVAPHFVQYVENYLAEKYGETTLQEGGLKVYTTLDPKMQEIAERAVSEGAKKNLGLNGHNAALVAMDPKTGQILAMVGSKDYFGESEPEGCAPGKTCLFEPNVNVATTLQQPGSSFKPYAYVTAFGRDFKYSPASMLMDANTNVGDYTPKNFNLGQNGPVSMRKALAGSLNTPAVKTIALVGENNVIKTAKDVGINSPFKDCGLALVLGGCDVKLVDHVAGYGTLANGGKREKQTSILKVVSQEGQTLEEYKEDSQQVLDPQAVYELVSIMTDNQARSYVFGSNSALTLGNRPVAAKTGTTQDFRDGWTLGFTPSLVAGVWTGNNNNSPMKQDAVVTAGPIWNKFMKEALADTPIEQFNEPDGIKHVTVDSVSGLLPTQYTPETKSEVFADYSVPSKYDNVHVPVEIDSMTGLPATSDTPDDRKITEVYTVLHSEKPQNSAWEQPVIAWALENGYKYPPGSGIENTSTQSDKIQFNSPKDGGIINKLPFDLSVNITGEVSKVTISLDGSTVGTLDNVSGSFSTNVNKKLADGTHNLNVKVNFKNGSSANSSIKVRYALDSGLIISSPGDGESIALPWLLEAESNTKLQNVSFYYIDNNNTVNIGKADEQKSGSSYRYLLNWDDSISPGTYKVFARSSDGESSSKVTITVN